MPWCCRSQVLDVAKDGRSMHAELVVGYPPVTERYVSLVSLDPPNSVKVQVEEGRLFDLLRVDWVFEEGPIPGSSWLVFVVDFKFANSFYQRMANLFFKEVVLTLRSSFEKRCQQIYGPGSFPSKKLWSDTTEVHSPKTKAGGVEEWSRGRPR